MRQAGLIFRRRDCRREDGHGLRDLSSAEELAGGKDGHGRRGLPSAEELAGGRMDAVCGAYLPPKNLPEGGWMR